MWTAEAPNVAVWLGPAARGAHDRNYWDREACPSPIRR